MSDLLSVNLATVPDQPGQSSTFYVFGADRIDVTAYGFDVKVEIMAPSGQWSDPKRVAANLHRGFTGLSLQYRGGAAGVRVSNWTPGNVASCDIEAAGVEGK